MRENEEKEVEREREWEWEWERKRKTQWRVIKKRAWATRDVINARANHAEARLARSLPRWPRFSRQTLRLISNLEQGKSCRSFFRIINFAWYSFIYFLSLPKKEKRETKGRKEEKQKNFFKSPAYFFSIVISGWRVTFWTQNER